MRQIPLSIFGRAPRPSHDELTAEKSSVTEPVKQETESSSSPIPENIPVKEEEAVAETDSVVENSEAAATQNVDEVTAADNLVKEELEVATKEESAEAPKENSKPVSSEEVEERPKRRRSSKKTEEQNEITSVSMKLTGASKLPDVVALIVPEYEDPSYDEFMEHMNQALLHTVFDERADAGVIKVILSNLARCYDNATRKYADVSSKLETIANKNYGLIARQIAANSVGSNDAERKKIGLAAPEVYKTSNKTVNLYAAEAGLRRQMNELQTIIKQIEFKKSAIIAYLTAEKMDANV